MATGPHSRLDAEVEPCSNIKTVGPQPCGSRGSPIRTSLCRLPSLESSISLSSVKHWNSKVVALKSWAMGINDNIPESSFGTINSELTASDPLLPENETTTSLLTSTGIHNSKTRCGESQTPVAGKAQEPQAPKGTVSIWRACASLAHIAVSAHQRAGFVPRCVHGVHTLLINPKLSPAP